MVRKELVDAIQERMPEGTTKALMDEFLTALTEVIQETVASGNKVKILGFGTFSRKEVKGTERECKLPTAKGKIIKTEDTYKVVFHSGKQFDDIVKGIKG